MDRSTRLHRSVNTDHNGRQLGEGGATCTSSWCRGSGWTVPRGSASFRRWSWPGSCWGGRHERRADPAAVPRGRGRGRLAVAVPRRERALPHRLVRGRRRAGRRDRPAGGHGRPPARRRPAGRRRLRPAVVAGRRLGAQRGGRRAGPGDLGGRASGGRDGRPVRGPVRPAHRRRADRADGDRVLARGARLRGHGPGGPDRPARARPVAVVPGHGRAAPAAQPHPRRPLAAARPGRGAHRRRGRRRRPGGLRQARPAWWTLADPEDNEVDIATWQGRE
jgi:hypothetical protein